MNSFNHYSYGAVGDWMYRVSAGIETIGPGYKHILIQPHPTNKMTYSKASFKSSYGVIESGWERINNKIVINVRIPANTNATIVIPTNSPSGIIENSKSLAENKAISDIRMEANKVIFEAGSGDYVFEYKEE